MVFQESWGPLDFSNYIDNVVNKSKVSYETWSEVYRYIGSEHSWIEEHECSKPASKVSEKVEQFSKKLFTTRYTSDGTLDVYDVQEKMNFIALNMINNGDYKLAKLALEPIVIEMVKYFKSNYENGYFYENPYWAFYFSILSKLMINLAVCELNMRNDNACVNLASTSVKISIDDGEELIDKARDLILMAITRNGWASLKDPIETLQEGMPRTLNEKAGYLYNRLYEKNK